MQKTNINNNNTMNYNMKREDQLQTTIYSGSTLSRHMSILFTFESQTHGSIMLRLINQSLQIMHLDSWVQGKFNNFSRDVSLLNNLLSDTRVHENP